MFNALLVESSRLLGSPKNSSKLIRPAGEDSRHCIVCASALNSSPLATPFRSRSKRLRSGSGTDTPVVAAGSEIDADGSRDVASIKANERVR
jgi:hypothetical protein